MSSGNQLYQEMEFEIDRMALLRYWRIQSMIGCCSAGLAAGLLLGAALFLNFHDAGSDLSHWAAIGRCLRYMASGAAIGLIVGCAAYAMVFHSSCKLASLNLRLLVEAPYLRMISGGAFVVDRRIHICELSDFTIHDGPLLREGGLRSLRFRQRIHKTPLYTWVKITGLVDANQVRDTLCEISDAIEKNACVAVAD